jgi:hypothetical protein
MADTLYGGGEGGLISSPSILKRRLLYTGVYEYCGPQRCGKNTLMTADLVFKVRKRFPWVKVYTNSSLIGLGNVVTLNSQALGLEILAIKDRHETDIVIIFDELGQELGARSFDSKTQTKIVNFAWQMPKRRILFMYSDNLGNSADVVLRLATWFVIMPKFIRANPISDSEITVNVIDCIGWSGQQQILKGTVVKNLPAVWPYFDSDLPVD